MNKSNMSWEQAFRECAESMNRHELIMEITNELYPLSNGSLRENWIGLTKECRDKIYTKLVEIDKEKALQA
jgi:hypothetical protein